MAVSLTDDHRGFSRQNVTRFFFKMGEMNVSAFGCWARNGRNNIVLNVTIVVKLTSDRHWSCDLTVWDPVCEECTVGSWIYRVTAIGTL
jgi:hypothetical protein